MSAALPPPRLDLGLYSAVTSITDSQGSAPAGPSEQGKVHPRASGLWEEGTAGRASWRVNVQYGILCRLEMFLSNLCPTSPSHTRLLDPE